MRVSELVEVVHGKLLKNPLISSFNGFSTNLKTIERGNLFIALDETHIQEAIAFGAYGVLFSHEVDMCDDEIAWIRVDDLNDALLRLIRYKITSRDSHVVLLPPIEWQIARTLLVQKDALFFEGNPITLLEYITGFHKWYFFHEQIYERVSHTILRATSPLEMPFEVISNTLFDSKIFFDGHHHTLQLPQLFLKPLANVIHFFQMHLLPFDLARFTPITPLYPCFLNAKSKITKHGQSNRVVIAESDLEAFGRYAAYLKINAKWARILFVIPIIYAELFENFNLVKTYASERELLGILTQEEYNFAIILGVKLDFLQEHLKAYTHENSLFDF